ncbi:hypothetical protein CRX42_02315 [Pseudomonas jessenii]|uniref:Uncharacterized protein n=1 Tax=Pseudomonas jessenii TaxID=77298 RepID=A0A2W0F478_PSEJE|nr:hypothetical protein [Pseudomonas jessenii]PYY72185.1 hypothetical protein CRX42_02315 [Pseudomonas jessenii]
MKRIIALSAALAMNGCAGQPEYVQSDFTYEDMGGFSQVGVRATSKSAGKTVEVYAACDVDARRYIISRKSSSRYGGAGDDWTISIGGNRLFDGNLFYEDEAKFLADASTIELIGPKGSFGGQDRMMVSSPQMQRIPELCKEKQAQVMADIHRAEEKESAENERLISDVEKRTGAQPMLPGRNQMDFNNLVLLLQKDGISRHRHKFVWAQDGDYVVAQVLGDRVLLLSMNDQVMFPAITIITNEPAIEGQPWSSVSKGPLQLSEISNYPTALGVNRQTIVFKRI